MLNDYRMIVASSREIFLEKNQLQKCRYVIGRKRAHFRYTLYTYRSAKYNDGIH